MVSPCGIRGDRRTTGQRQGGAPRWQKTDLFSPQTSKPGTKSTRHAPTLLTKLHIVARNRITCGSRPSTDEQQRLRIPHHGACMQVADRVGWFHNYWSKSIRFDEFRLQYIQAINSAWLKRHKHLKKGGKEECHKDDRSLFKIELRRYTSQSEFITTLETRRLRVTWLRFSGFSKDWMT